jgi:GntR family transcriptional regulator
MRPDRKSPEGKIDFDRSGVSRYIQLSTLFRRRIATGEWQTDQQIPTVDELAEEFGVARATIRQAIGLLEKDGLISRFRAKGTFVNKRPDLPVWCELQTDWNGLLNSREGITIEILSDIDADLLPLALADPDQIAPRYRHLRRRHSRDGAAYLIADVYIDAELAQGLAESALRTTTAMRLAATLPGTTIANALQTLTVGSADLETAELLDLDLNAPVCCVDRRAFDQRGRLVLASLGIYRGDNFRMEIKLH